MVSLERLVDVNITIIFQPSKYKWARELFH